ncbi:RHS repeat-associated core domain-containing protein [Agaribacter flavus]|uniref:RHS repeat-associated core domain-containing protein n=1 Tax=Agaribacter flavus TaxID=1902781 RepID=A0ABV7FSD0_9ALTE
MNGRIYDQSLGRFLQADPFIQAPTNSQSFNRYSYVLNNPLSYTDPSGYFFKALGKFVKKYWRPLVAAVVGVITYGAASGWVATWGATWGTAATATSAATLTWAGGAAAGAITGFVAGAVGTGSLKGALRGAFSGAVFGGIGSAGWSAETTLGAHALGGGIISDLQGGNFGHGFVTAGVMKGVGMFNGASKGASISEIAGRATIQAIVGGTVSRVTGGKFANGAVTAAIQYTVNSSATAIQDGWKSFSKGASRFFGKILGTLGTLLTLEDTMRRHAHLNHYTTNENRALIDESGAILPGPNSGKVWMTPDTYATGEQARASLALDKTPDGYYKVPLTNIPPKPSHVGKVEPWNGEPGGGTEVIFETPISIENAEWVPISSGGG